MLYNLDFGPGHNKTQTAQSGLGFMGGAGWLSFLPPWLNSRPTTGKDLRGTEALQPTQTHAHPAL